MTIKKRAVVFVFVGLLTFLTGVLLMRVSPRLHSHHLTPWEVLLSFENQDLAGLSGAPQRELVGAVEKITGQRKTRESRLYVPALFKSISNTAGEERYVLVEESPLMIIPGESRIRVHVFDMAGRVLSTDDFAAGWRTSLIGFRVRNVPDLSGETLIVDTEYCFGGSPGHQLYALIGNRMELVNLQETTRWGKNSYLSSLQSIGPQVNRSADEWEHALSSPQPAEVLSALMWFGGHHWNGEPAPYDDNKADGEKYSALRARSSVQAKLNELSQSENYWISAAAKSALDADK